MTLAIPWTIDEDYVQEQYLENMDKKKGKPSGSKEKGIQNTFEEGKKNGKRKDKKSTSTMD